MLRQRSAPQRSPPAPSPPQPPPRPATLSLLPPCPLRPSPSPLPRLRPHRRPALFQPLGRCVARTARTATSRRALRSPSPSRLRLQRRRPAAGCSSCGATPLWTALSGAAESAATYRTSRRTALWPSCLAPPVYRATTARAPDTACLPWRGCLSRASMRCPLPCASGRSSQVGSRSAQAAGSRWRCPLRRGRPASPPPAGSWQPASCRRAHARHCCCRLQTCLATRPAGCPGTGASWSWRCPAAAARLSSWPWGSRRRCRCLQVRSPQARRSGCRFDGRAQASYALCCSCARGASWWRWVSPWRSRWRLQRRR
mmetsp:Transcript_42048/g.108993  ORF Transcript_42048/g.108993 Transcript_42048/m.108993 type:complete len:313 (-) Transcript_42048:214-1152(-)